MGGPVDTRPDGPYALTSGPPADTARGTVFLDRDGVLNTNRDDHVKSPAEVVILDGAVEAVKRITRAGVFPVVVTNQEVVGCGTITLAEAVEVHRTVARRLAREGAPLPAAYICPHAPDDGCGCRKPAPGMIHAAARELRLDLRRSCLVGDAMTDVAAARAAGIPAVLVLTGRGRAQLAGATPRERAGLIVARSLADAVDTVLDLVGAA